MDSEPQRMQRLWGLLVGALFFTFCMLCLGCKPSKYEIALDNGVIFLENIQREDGAICDTVNPLFDMWETVEATTALYDYYGDTSVPSVQSALRFLRSHENSAGMLCHNVKCSAAYCLETTSEYYVLLARVSGKEKIQPRMDILRTLQHPSGKWEIGNPDVREHMDFPSVTAFVLGAFQAAEMAPTHRDSAWAWLVSQQDTAGHWGVAWEYYGCTAYALWPVLRALRGEHTAEARAALEKGAAYVQDSQNAQGAWDSKAVGGEKQPSAELQTALMVAALQAVDDPKMKWSIRDGLGMLVDSQKPDGHWDGGYFPIANARYEKQEYVFATARAVVALNRYMEDTR